jgi:hypothetical protein
LVTSLTRLVGEQAHLQIKNPEVYAVVPRNYLISRTPGNYSGETGSVELRVVVISVQLKPRLGDRLEKSTSAQHDFPNQLPSTSERACKGKNTNLKPTGYERATLLKNQMFIGISHLFGDACSRLVAAFYWLFIG